MSFLGDELSNLSKWTLHYLNRCHRKTGATRFLSSTLMLISPRQQHLGPRGSSGSTSIHKNDSLVMLEVSKRNVWNLDFTFDFGYNFRSKVKFIIITLVFIFWNSSSLKVTHCGLKKKFTKFIRICMRSTSTKREWQRDWSTIGSTTCNSMIIPECSAIELYAGIRRLSLMNIHWNYTPKIKVEFRVMGLSFKNKS